MTSWGPIWWSALSFAFIESSIVALLMLAIAGIWRNSSALLRHALLLIALLKFAIPPSVLFIPLRIGFMKNVVIDVFPEWKTVAMLGYAAGSIIVLSLLLVRLRALGAIARRAKPVTDEVLLAAYRDVAGDLAMRRVPQLLMSDEAVVPISFGIVRPAILISSSLTDHLEEESLRALFGHELIHHRRGDLVISHAQAWLAVIWWFNPLFLFVSRAIERIREDACDEILLARRLTSDEAYCTLLLAAARNAVAPSLAIPATAITGRHPLHSRIERIMAGTARRERLSAPARWAVAIAALVLVMSFSPSPSSSSSPSPSPSDSPSDSPSPSPSPSPSISPGN